MSWQGAAACQRTERQQAAPAGGAHQRGGPPGASQATGAGISLPRREAQPSAYPRRCCGGIGVQGEGVLAGSRSVSQLAAAAAAGRRRRCGLAAALHGIPLTSGARQEAIVWAAQAAGAAPQNPSAQQQVRSPAHVTHGGSVVSYH